MLKIEQYADRNLRMLSHSPSVFHEALKYVLLGERRFHVHYPDGEDYDLVYHENDRLFQEGNGNDIIFDNAVLPPYFSYDETNPEKIDLSILDGFDTILFEEANEYTVAVTRLLQKERSMRIVFLDERIRYFFPVSGAPVRTDEAVKASGADALQAETGVVEYLPEDCEEVKRIREEAGAFLCSKNPGDNRAVVQGLNIVSSDFLFHNIFVWQWLTDLPLGQIRYVSATVMRNAGIGAVLDHFMRMKRIFAKKGIETFLRPGTTRYSDPMLHRFFDFAPLPEDMDESNTIFLENIMPLRVTVLFYHTDGSFHRDMLNAQFYNEISFYYDEVLRQRKVLGVLMRGTDYINLKMDGKRRHARCDEMIPVIDEWLREEGFEEIFLATEDADILDQMKEHYQDRLVVVSQERYRVSDFKRGEYLSDVEKRKNSLDQEAVVEDTVANYFYALVILSKCAAFLCSGQCNGWDVVNTLNEGKFLRSECVSDRFNA